jgi:hypothetical protein
MFRQLIYVFSLSFVLSLVITALAVDADVTIHSFDAPVIDGIVDDVWSSSTEHLVVSEVYMGNPG